MFLLILVSCLLFAIVCCLLFVVVCCCLLFAVCCLLLLVIRLLAVCLFVGTQPNVKVNRLDFPQMQVGIDLMPVGRLIAWQRDCFIMAGETWVYSLCDKHRHEQNNNDGDNNDSNQCSHRNNTAK